MKKREIKIWYGKLEDAERFLDMKFWQAIKKKNYLNFCAAG